VLKSFEQRKRAQQVRLHPLFTLGVLGAGLGAQVGAQAQTPPDAGSLRRQIEQEQKPQLPARGAGELVKPGTVNNFLPGATRVQVKAFDFVGNRLMTDAELKAIAAPWVGKALDMASLQAVAAAVGQAYRERGWVVRSLLPRQEVKDGIIRIEIVEARFGKLTDDGTPSGRVSAEQVRAFVQNRLVHGEAVNTVPLDRGLMLADDLPGVTVSGRLVQGAQPNETDIALKITPEPLLVGDVGIDNFGARSTGNARASANVGLNSPLGFGDMASGSLIHTKGTDSYATGDVTSSSSQTGGLIGSVNQTGSNLAGVTLSNVYATGDVTGTTYSGGLVGALTGGSSASHNKLSDAYASGSVTSDGSNTGGLIGGASGYLDITNSHASGDVVTDQSTAGGLIGSSSGTITIAKSYATGDVTATASGVSNIGGLIGSMAGTTVNTSFASGDVTGTSYTGGLIGAMTSGSLNGKPLPAWLQYGAKQQAFGGRVPQGKALPLNVLVRIGKQKAVVTIAAKPAAPKPR